jgi:hypothetical protein
MNPSTPGDRLLGNAEIKRMADQEDDRSGSDADSVDSEGERSSSGPPSERTDAGRPTDQAIINQEQALESGEENAV